ncbi:MAG TPA: hypothetical protein VFU82_04875 [Gammaproteobacteria bacterium]|nr:hypothetical protein [Gammaproteobacteria bacterium]
MFEIGIWDNSAAIKDWEIKDEKRKKLKLANMECGEGNYLGFAKFLLTVKLTSEVKDDLKNVFAYKGAKNEVLRVLRDNPGQFPELRTDITKTALYYLLSCRKDGFGRKDSTCSLNELRAIQNAQNWLQTLSSLDECYKQLIADQNEWSQYEFMLRYEYARWAKLKLTPQNQTQYHDAIVAFMKKTKSGTRKLTSFFKLDSQADPANYKKACALIKDRYQPRRLNDGQLVSLLEKFKEDKRFDVCIRFAAAVDRREVLKDYLLSDEAVVAFLKDNYKDYSKFFSAGKLRPMIAVFKPPVEGEEPEAPQPITRPKGFLSLFSAPVSFNPPPEGREGREMQEFTGSDNKK